MRVSAIIPAAGSGKRMGLALEKQFIDLVGEPIIVHTLKALNENQKISLIYLVTPPEKIHQCQEELAKYNLSKLAGIVAGGKERQDSVANGFACLDKEIDLVLVHDGVRPLVAQRTIDRVIDAAQKNGAAIAALPVKDTIKEINENGFVTLTLERNKLWAIQTPQVFRYNILKAAFMKAKNEGFYGTDEASLVEFLGHPVQVVEGNPENIKITTPEDLIVAKALLKT